MKNFLLTIFFLFAFVSTSIAQVSTPERTDYKRMRVQSSTPVTPAANWVHVFVNSTGSIAWVDSTGAVSTPMSSSGGTTTDLLTTSSAASTVALTAKGFASQTADIFNVKNSANTVLVKVDKDGILTAVGLIGPLTGNVTGNVSGTSGSTTGNAATATALQTARTIAGVSFNGTANIAIASTDLSNSSDIVLLAGSQTITGAKTFSDQIISTVTTGTPPLVIASTTNIPNLNASSLNGATFAAPGAIGGGTPGNITGLVITANTNFAGNLTGNVTGNVSGTADNISGIALGANGGTGIANTGKTITLGGNFVTSGAFNTTLTVTGDTNVTLPTTGTLVNSSVATLSSLTSIGTLTSLTNAGNTNLGDAAGDYTEFGGSGFDGVRVTSEGGAATLKFTRAGTSGGTDATLKATTFNVETSGVNRGGHSTSTINNITANGAAIAITSISESITLNTGGTTTDSTANLLPANSIILAVVARVTTTITTATDWRLGDATTDNRFTAANSTLTSGTTDYGFRHQQGSISTDATGPIQTSAAKLRITTTGTPGAGVVRVTVYYINLTAPTS